MKVPIIRSRTAPITGERRTPPGTIEVAAAINDDFDAEEDTVVDASVEVTDDPAVSRSETDDWCEPTQPFCGRPTRPNVTIA